MSDTQLAIVNNPTGEDQLSAEHIDRRLRAYLSRQIDRVDPPIADASATDIFSTPDLVHALDEYQSITENLAAIGATRGRLIRSLLDRTSGQERVINELRAELADRDQATREILAGLAERDGAISELQTGLNSVIGRLLNYKPG